MDKFREMQAFVAVVDCGSFVGAADALATSKAAVSRLVADLETRLGVRLLQRTTRRLSLTDEGQVFVGRCRELLGALEAAESDAGSRAAEASGVLRVNAPLSFGILHLAPLWGAFVSAHPKIALEVSLIDRVVDLVEEGYDLAVRIGRLPASSLISRQLATTRMVACATPAYLAEHGVPQTPADLASHAAIAYSYFSSGNEWEFHGPGGSVKVQTRPRFLANNGDTCLAAALAHQGIILQPTFLVGTALADGRLVELLPGWRSIELGIHVVYASRRQQALKLRKLIDFLVEVFRTPRWPD